MEFNIVANSSAGRANLSMSERHPNRTSGEDKKQATSSAGHSSPPKINTGKRKDHSRIIKLKVRVRFLAPSAPTAHGVRSGTENRRSQRR